MKLSQQIIKAGWQLVETGMTDGTSGNISVRCPGEAVALITPSARDFHFITERDLVRVHLESGSAKGRWKPSSEWRLHAAIYKARPDVNAIVHFHPTWASAVAVARKTIPVLIDEAADIGPIPTVPYASSGSEELAENAAQGLSTGNNAVLLANHGAVAVGRDLWEATRRALEVERLAKIFIGAGLLGGAHALDEAQIIRTQKSLEAYRAASVENQQLFSPMPSGIGRVSLQNLMHYGFQAGVTFAFLFWSLIHQQFDRRNSAWQDSKFERIRSWVRKEY
jgi:L-ribulose-5-phosphate 4-epimerase